MLQTGLRAGVVLVVLNVSFAPSFALAATLYVAQGLPPNPLGRGSCVRPHYATIQGAVDAAAEGDSIVVCGGVYVEQPEIVRKSLSLVGLLGATIAAPAAGTDAVVRFAGPQTSTIKGFRVTGAGAPGINTGIRADGFDFDVDPPPGNLTTFLAVVGNRVVDIPRSGITPGRGIFIEEAEGEVVGNVVERYADEGIRVDGNQVVCAASVVANHVRGEGARGSSPSQVGILIDECDADVRRNHVSDNLGADDTELSAGLLVEFANVVAEQNVLTNNRVGIRLEPGPATTLERNVVRRSVQNGIELIGSRSAVVSQNRVSASGGFDLFDDTGDPPLSDYSLNLCTTSSPAGLCL